MIRRSTWILLVILAALVVLAWYLRQPKTETEATPTSAVTYLFTPEDGIVTSLNIQSMEGQVVNIQRGSESKWVVTLPESADADQGSVEEVVSQINALRVLNALAEPLERIGLETPAYMITIQFTSSKQYTLSIGDITPTSSGYYVQREDGSLVIVDKVGLDAVLTLLSNPPYAKTLTPTP